MKAAASLDQSTVPVSCSLVASQLHHSDNQLCQCWVGTLQTTIENEVEVQKASMESSQVVLYYVVETWL